MIKLQIPAMHSEKFWLSCTTASKHTAELRNNSTEHDCGSRANDSLGFSHCVCAHLHSDVLLQENLCCLRVMHYFLPYEANHSQLVGCSISPARIPKYQGTICTEVFSKSNCMCFSSMGSICNNWLRASHPICS